MTKAKKKDNKDASEDEIAKLKADLQQMTEAAQRAMADLQNFKRRTEEERSEIQIFANGQLLQVLFPIIDDFARAFENIPEDLKGNEWVKGIEVIEQNLSKTLASLGLEVIDQTGVAADPNIHEVLMEGDGPTGEVVKIFEKGYTFKGKTIRPAKVQVGKS